MDKLLSCPFCGGEARVSNYEMGFGVYCRNTDCLIQLAAFYPTEEQAIAAWNRRVGPELNQDQPERRYRDDGARTESVEELILERNRLAQWIKDCDASYFEDVCDPKDTCLIDTEGGPTDEDCLECIIDVIGRGSNQRGRRRG